MSDLKATLSLIHNEMAKAILERIKSGEATAADFVAAMRFLKEADFEPNPESAQTTEDIRNVVPFPGAATPF